MAIKRLVRVHHLLIESAWSVNEDLLAVQLWSLGD